MACVRAECGGEVTLVDAFAGDELVIAALCRLDR